jgi:hypothetical protein
MSFGRHRRIAGKMRGFAGQLRLVTPALNGQRTSTVVTAGVWRSVFAHCGKRIRLSA